MFELKSKSNNFDLSLVSKPIKSKVSVSCLIFFPRTESFFLLKLFVFPNKARCRKNTFLKFILVLSLSIKILSAFLIMNSPSFEFSS